MQHYRSGSIVEVRSEAEIRSTLDANGMFEGVPFMDEMRRFCGRRFRVFRRTDKICVEGDVHLEIRRMRNAVMLEEVRCDGTAHDGCKRLCMVFWKEAWLKPAPSGAAAEPPPDWVGRVDVTSQAPIDETKTYRCQSTALYRATETLRGWDIRQYARDLASGALRPWELAKVAFFMVYNKIARSLGREEYGAIFGSGKRTPAIALNLRAGDVVEVKEHEELAATLDAQGRNRGLLISYEMLRHCGARLPVITPIDRMILENSGKMKSISNTVLLQGTSCSGLCVRGCARNSHPMWREAWLRRVGPDGESEGPVQEIAELKLEPGEGNNA